MNAITVLVLVEQHKLEQDAATGMQLALGHSSPTACQLMLMPGPLDLQQLALVVFFLPSTSANTLLALGWLLSATCTGGLVHISTGAYIACADCNLCCVVVVVVVYIQFNSIQ